MNQRTIKHAWSQARLEEIANKIGSGATPRGGEKAYQTEGIPLIRSQNVVFFNFKRDGLAFISEEQARLLSNVEVLANDVLLNITGASIGRVTIAPQDMEGARVNQHVCIIRPVEGIDVRYLNAYLSSPDKQVEITNENYGVTRQALTKQQISDFIVPVPPSNEQKRIADKLDAVLARVDACRERLDRVPGILKRFRQAVLAAATSGTLTEEWREENNALDTWKTVTLGQCANKLSYGSSNKSEKTGIIPVLRMGNIQNGRLDWTDLVYTNDKSEITKYSLSKGDVLFNRTNSPELVGKTAVYSGEYPATYAGYLIKIQCKDVLTPEYINYCLNSPRGRDYCWQVKSDGVSQSNINAKKLAAFSFGLPIIEEQHEIVRRVEALFAFSDALEVKYRAASEQVGRLRPALLAKAFRGELVPQDPSDEPAVMLLERIRAARSVQPAATRTRRTRTPRQTARSASAQSVSAIPEHAASSTTQTTPAPPLSSFDPTSALVTPAGSRTLADLRKAAGLNQSVVAKAMGLNQAYVSQMENGKRAITEDKRCQLAEILGVSVEEIPR